MVNSTLASWIHPNPDPSCPDPNSMPTISEFYQGLGGYAIALYVGVSLSVLVVAIEFIYLTIIFIKKVPASRRVPTIWVNSVFLIATIMAFFGIVVPKSSDFVWMFYRVYLGLAMGYFVDITLHWYGGEQEMVRTIGDGNDINFRVRPCCWCLACPKKTPLTREKIKLLRAAVYQMPYIQTPAVFLLVVLNLSGYSVIGDLDPAKPYLYLMIWIMASFFLGIWALFSLFGITMKYNALNIHHYAKKATIFKIIVIATNVQGFVIDSCSAYGIIQCAGPLISSQAMGAIIKTLLTIAETIVMGSVVLKLYISDNNHV